MTRRILFLTLAAATLGAQELTLDQVLQKHYEAMGGVEKMKALKTLRMTGKMVIMGGQMEAATTMVMKRPNKMRMDMNIQGRSLIRASDGATAWQTNPFVGSGEPAAMTGDEAKDMLESAGDMDGVLIDYKAKGHTVELLGKEDVEGSAAYKLKVTRKSSRVETHFLDASSFFPVKIQSKVTQAGQEMEVESFPGNFKKVEGVMTPHSIDQKVGGRSMMAVTMEKIEPNVEVDDAMFKMPAPAPKPEEKKN